jgi:DNA-binding NtrC family response regulator
MILIVDDDPNFLETAREALGRDNQVFLASDPAQAYKLAENLGFSVVLVDLELGGANGFDLIEKMHESFPHLPVIAISGVTSLSTLESATEFGAVGFLEKPIGPEWNDALIAAARERMEKISRPPSTRA